MVETAQQQFRQHSPMLQVDNVEQSIVLETDDYEEECRRLVMENQELQRKVQCKEQELLLQQKSMKNLATTVVKQDQYIKQLIQKMEDLRKQSSKQVQFYQQDVFGQGSLPTHSDSLERDSYNEMLYSPEAGYNGTPSGENPRSSLDLSHSSSPSLNRQPVQHSLSKKSRASTPYSQKSYDYNVKNSRVSPPPRHNNTSPLNRRRLSNGEYNQQDEFDGFQLNRSQSMHVRQSSRRFSTTSIEEEEGALLQEMDFRRLCRQTSEHPTSNRGQMTYRERAQNSLFIPAGDMNKIQRDDTAYATSRRSLHRSHTGPAHQNSGVYSGSITHRGFNNNFRRSTGSHAGRYRNSIEGDGYGRYERPHADDRYSGYRESGRHLERSSWASSGSRERSRKSIEDFDDDDDFDVELLKNKIQALENEEMEGGWPLEDDTYLDS